MSAPILIPLDGSEFAAQSLPHALSAARRLEAPLHLVAVYQPVIIDQVGASVASYDRRFDIEQRAELASQLRATALAVQPLVEHGVTHATLEDDSVDGAILAEADRIGAQLIVTTTHGRGGLQRAWLGSIADRLVVTAKQPVLLVRPVAGSATALVTDSNDEEAVAVAGGAGGFRRVLIPLDGSPLAEEIIRHAITLAEADAEYCMLRVVRVPATRTHPEQTYWTPLERDAIDEARVEATRYLEEYARPLLPAGTDATAFVVLSASPAAAILETARTWGADLVAIGTHGRSGIARLVAGSVADKVYRGSEVPTLVARPQGGT